MPHRSGGSDMPPRTTRVRGPAERFVRHWIMMFRLTRRVLKPYEQFVIGVSHVVFLGLERVLNEVGTRIFKTFPRQANPPAWRGIRATVVLAPGLGQSPFSCYPFAKFLAVVFGFRVLLMQTHQDGNTEPFEHMVARNQWILCETGSEPLIGIGFSKGLLDLVWTFAPVVYNNVRNERPRQISLVAMSAPIRGSRVAKEVRMPGAGFLAPGTPEIRQTVRMIDAFRKAGVPMHFFCAVWGDFIVRRSDTRPPNDEGYRPPTVFERIRGDRRAPPWYWSSLLWFQIGHTAIYNPFAWLQVGIYVSTNLLPRL